MQAFYRLTNPDGPNGLSVLQALVMKGDLSTTETILRFSPSGLDVSIALLTTGTADLLVSRMRTLVNLSLMTCSPDQIPVKENSNSDAAHVLYILNKTVKNFQRRSLLREVVSKGSLSQLQKVLARCTKLKENRKSCLEKTDQRGRTLLMSACASGKSEVVEFLLGSGTRMDPRDNKQRTALHFAVANNSLDVVKLLVRAGACIYDEDDCGLMSLHYASQNGRREIALFFIEHGCDVNRPTGDTYEGSERSLTGCTALHFAAQNGHNETIVLLLSKGAGVDSVKLNGQTPLLLAAERGHVSTVELLLHRGADINASDVYQNTALEIAVLAKK
ncbi:26S proteasome non-ATPase regulatory subunit 10-like, partial [Stylophora pistillata]